MHIKIISARNGYKQVVHLVAETLKSLKVWKVRFQDGVEVVLFKSGSVWMQRNEDNLEHWLLKAIGEKIDQIYPEISYS